MKVLLGFLYFCAHVHFTIAAKNEDNLVTLDFGDDCGDLLGPFLPEAVSPEVHLDGKYIFFGREETSLFISENGLISFRDPFSSPIPQPLPLTSPDGGTSPLPPAFIAGFWGDIEVQKNGGGIFYIEMDRPRANGRFGRAKADVLNLLYEGFGHSMEDFDPTHIFLSTWEGVHETGELVRRAVTFQIVLVTDSNRTYVLLLYSDVRWDMSSGHGVLVGFNAGDGVNSFTHPLTNGSILDLDVETNARSTGAFVYRVDGKEIVEPTNAEREEHVCVNAFIERRSRLLVIECTCPDEERPRVAFNKINCLYDRLAINFQDDTPIVSEDSMTAHFSANRPGVEMYCHIPKIDRSSKEDCSSGVYERNELLPDYYSVRIVVLDPTTRERAVLRGSFTILDPNVREGEEVCGVTITNRGSAQTGSNVEITFTGTGATTNFLCRLDTAGDRLPCESPLVLADLEPGSHRAVIIPRGDACSSTDASSFQFTVAA